MANIAQGTSGQASYAGPDGSGAEPPYWTIKFIPVSGLPYIMAYSGGGEAGWSVSSTGVVGVPESATLGSYQAKFYGSEESSLYNFTVTEAEEGNDCAKTAYAGTLGESVAGTTVTVHMTAGISSGATTGQNDDVTVVVSWGDGSQSTHGGTAVNGAAFNFDAAHTYTVAGDFAISWVASYADCGGGTAGGGISYSFRHYCESGACVLRYRNSPTGGAMSCAELDCETDPEPTGYVCVPDPYGANHCTSEIPGGYEGQIFDTLEECEGNCEGTTAPEPVQRWFCVGGNCVPQMVSDGSGFATELLCLNSGCEDTTEPTNCTYIERPIVDISQGTTYLSLSLSRLGNESWNIVVTHAIDDVPQAAPTIQIVSGAWRWNVPRTVGVHQFIAEMSKVGCTQTYTADIEITVEDDGEEGGGGGGGEEGGDGCGFVPNPIAVIWDGKVYSIALRTFLQSVPGWTPTATHKKNGVYIDSPQFFNGLEHNTRVLFITAEPGTHLVEILWQKPGCSSQTTQAEIVVPALWCVEGQIIYSATAPVGNSGGPFNTINDAANACIQPCENTVVFEFPAANATLAALNEIVVRYSGDSPLAANNPMAIYFNGTPLPVTRSPGDARQFVAVVPESVQEWQGAITLSAQLTHEIGCLSPLVTRHVFVNGTILDDTRWGDILNVETAPHEAVQVDVILDAPTPTKAYFYELAVSSPPPDDSPPPQEPTSEDQLALETTWARLQKCTANSDTPLLGLRDENGEYTAPTTEAICRIKASRQWKRIRYAMAAPLTKIRAVKDEDGSDAFLFYALPYIYRLDATGFKLFQNLSEAQTVLGAPLRDATVRRSKTYVVAGNDGTEAIFAEVDTDAPDAGGAQISQTSTPFGAPTRAAFTETMKATSDGVVSIVRVYTDATKSVVYESWPGVDGMETRKRFEVAGTISYFTVLGATIAFVLRNVGAPVATNGSKIYVWTRGDNAPTLLYTSPSPVVFLHLESEAGNLCFGNEGDDLVFLTANSIQTFLVDAGFAPRATTFYNPGDGDVRVYGGDDNRVWWKRETVFTPFLMLPVGESVVGAERWTETVVVGDGDPLNGGTPSTTIDSLLLAIHSDSGDYVLRYQRRERPPLAYEGSGIDDIEFSSTLLRAGVVEGI
ncbi:hypothetical protein EON83_11195 [bacterium]|nr:MAG: hypothetical protein EON83_11195 [bacterium]